MIIIAHMAARPSSAEEIAKRIGWSDIEAVKRGMVVCDIPNDLILQPGHQCHANQRRIAQRPFDGVSQLRAGRRGVGLRTQLLRHADPLEVVNQRRFLRRRR